MGATIASRRGRTVGRAAAGWCCPATCRWCSPNSDVGMVATALEQHAGGATPSTSGRRGHPVGFAAELYSELVQLDGRRRRAPRDAALPGARAAMTDDAGVLMDVDTPARPGRAAPPGCGQARRYGSGGAGRSELRRSGGQGVAARALAGARFRPARDAAPAPSGVRSRGRCTPRSRSAAAVSARYVERAAVAAAGRGAGCAMHLARPSSFGRQASLRRLSVKASASTGPLRRAAGQQARVVDAGGHARAPTGGRVRRRRCRRAAGRPRRGRRRPAAARTPAPARCGVPRLTRERMRNAAVPAVHPGTCGVRPRRTRGARSATHSRTPSARRGPARCSRRCWRNCASASCGSRTINSSAMASLGCIASKDMPRQRNVSGCRAGIPPAAEAATARTGKRMV